MTSEESKCDLEIKSKIYEELKDNFDLYWMSIDELCETIEKSIIAITNRKRGK